MQCEGGCYCGDIRYAIDAKPIVHGQCHCRACQHFSGGAVNVFMLIPAEGFRYTKGAAEKFTRPDKPDAVTREFCPRCGTQLVTRRPLLAPVIVKVGTLDDPSIFNKAQIAIFTAEGQAFHHIDQGVAAYVGLPPGS